MPSLILPRATRPRLLSVSFLAGTQSDDNLTNYTFSGQSLGTPAHDRKIVVAVFAPSNILVSSMTIGGVAASLLYRPGDTSLQPEFWYASVPTGSTVDVVVNGASADIAKGIAMWRVTGWAGALHDSEKNAAGAEANPDVAIDIAAYGVVLCAARNNSSEALTGDWTNATERYNGSTAPTHIFAAADTTSTTALTRTITCTMAASGRMTAVSLLPTLVVS